MGHPGQGLTVFTVTCLTRWQKMLSELKHKSVTRDMFTDVNLNEALQNVPSSLVRPHQPSPQTHQRLLFVVLVSVFIATTRVIFLHWILPYFIILRDEMESDTLVSSLDSKTMLSLLPIPSLQNWCVTLAFVVCEFLLRFSARVPNLA